MASAVVASAMPAGHGMLDEVPAPHNEQAGESRTQIGDLPPELLGRMLGRLDADSLARTSLVCRTWRDAVCSHELWRDRLGRVLLEQLDALSRLGGPAVTPAHLHLALQGRNFLRNPMFRPGENTSLLPRLAAVAMAGGSSRWPSLGKWQRNAWVLNATVGKEVAWERAPLGMAADGEAPSGAAPLPPLPYPGSGSAPKRLSALMHRALHGLMALADVAPAAAVGAQPPQPALQPEPPGCLASLGTWSEVVQVVDLEWELQRRGLSAAQATHLLDAGLSLHLSVHVGTRLDAQGEYGVGLLLDEGDGGGDTPIPSLQSFVMRPTRHHSYAEREHMPGGAWERFETRVPAVPKGCRRAIVMLRGRRAPEADDVPEPATRFCGAKFSCAELVFG
ncbi:hypothetical protein TSOC_007940 [Tetrabaena socialis]|uniref:F-box domain-containing protein n=1 Tax=Tetrabaena socialis TaxID=47790 RepID=A0A2J7ZZU1_9CHLO|nr:hypothetical protein TSOC_007940 [Tetrabaena socialis]|eukprot:PNH05782.1 hypothetical protein TSOC_007940 [Tetrabaena socialis]